MRLFNTPWRCTALALILVGVGPGSASAQFAKPTIVLDYTYDQPANGGNNFFGSVGSPQRLALEAAAAHLTSRLGDTLASIVPTTHSWTARITHPGTGAENFIAATNPTIQQNEIRVYAGGRSLGGPLGRGGPGGFGASGPSIGFQAWFDHLNSRGQAGALTTPATDFGPWGGAITFDTATNWNFSIATGPTISQFDFLSVAEHELGHLLGIGTADSWFDQINFTTARFTGAATTALNGGVSPFVAPPDGAHFDQATTYLGQPIAMTPSISNNQRKLFTELDFAALDDIGWQLTPVPEPTTVLGLAAAALGLAGVVRRRRLSRAAA